MGYPKMRKLLLSVLIGLLPISVALAETSQQYFEQGNKAFNEEHYEQAIDLYLQAEKQGLQLPALYYNLAASYFKLEQYDKAEVYFRKLLKVPGMKHLAMYNLAVIAKKRGDMASAEKQFQALLSDDTPPQIRNLARRQLDDIQFLSKDRTSFFLGGGYDSNINAAPSGGGTGVSDMFVQIYARTEGVISGDVYNNRRYELSLYNQTYLSTTAYDITDMSVGLIQEKRDSGKTSVFNPSFTISNYGGAPYMNKLTLDYRGQKGLKESRFQLDFYNSATATYNYLNGYRFRYRNTGNRYEDGARYRKYYEFEYNDRADTGTTSYSPVRNTLRWYRYSPKVDGAYGRTDLSLRMSNYPSVAGTQRNDLRTRIGYKHYQEQEDGIFSWGYTFTLNLSTVASDSYNKHLFSVSYQWR